MGEDKDVIKDTFTSDQLVTKLITLQEYAEEQYIAKFNRLAGRQSRLNEDHELVALALQISAFKLRLVSEEHALATGPGADYAMNMGNASTAIVSNGKSASTYEVDTQVFFAVCFFLRTLGLVLCDAAESM